MSTPSEPEPAGYVMDKVKLTDEPFIFNSWIRSYHQSPEGSSMRDNIYAERQHKRIEMFLARATFIMLRPDDWDEGIVGYACGERMRGQNVFHYAFVKTGFRGQGHGDRLLQAIVDQVFEKPTHRAVFTHLREPYTKALMRRRFRWNPYYIDSSE